MKISMIKRIKTVIENFPEEIKVTATSPAADHLFQIREDTATKVTSEEQTRQFHCTIAQLLFISARAHRDIQTAVAYLTTRVKAPDEDDRGKLKRVLKYLKGTLYMKLVITVDNMNTIRC